MSVTAQKREERAIDVPIGLSTLRGVDLPRSSTNALDDIALSTPNFTFVQTGGGGQNSAFIRGVGALSGTPINSLDNSIGYSIDGVPFSILSLGLGLFDVERIEVLRGPQGTLYGRNTIGGAFNVYTVQPSSEPDRRAGIEFGERGHVVATTAVGGSIVPGLVDGRIAFRFDRDGPDIPNIVTGGRENEARNAAGRASLRITPSLDTTITLSATVQRENTTQPALVLRDQPGGNKSALDRSRNTNRELESVSATVNHRFDSFDLTSITSFTHFRGGYKQDLTDALVFSRGFGLPFSTFVDATTDRSYFVQDENLFNQEVRLNSKPDAPFSWVVGANYFYSGFNNNFTNSTQSLPPSFNGAALVALATQSASVFGDATVPITEALKASFGLRVGGDYQTYNARWFGFGPFTVPSFTQNDDYSDTFAVGRFALSYAITPEARVYASIANGFSAGGFTQSPRNAPSGLPDDPVKPTRSISYEAGIKTGRPGTYEINAAVFYNDIKDGQLFALEPATFRFIPESQDFRTAGAEIEARVNVTPRFEFFGVAGLTHTEITDVPGGQSSTGARNGNRVPYVPRYNLAVGGEYRHLAAALFDGLQGEVYGRLEYRHVGSRAADIANTFDLRPYNVLNLRAGWRHGTTEVYAFANNALNDVPELAGGPFGDARIIVPGRSRVVGAGALFRW